jgi:hypothetical protein
MSRTYDHRARPWRATDDPDHIECLRCGDPLRPAGGTWRHADEDTRWNRPLPAHAPAFDAAAALVAAACRDMPPDAGLDAFAHAAADILYWRGALKTRQADWRRPDQRRKAA